MAWDPRRSVVVRPPQFEAPPRPFKVTFASDLAGKDPAPLTWLVEGVIPRRTVTLLAGPPGASKSFICLMLMVAAAGGKPWFGRTVERVKSYALFSEDPLAVIHSRHNRIAEHYEIETVDLDDYVAFTAEPDDGKPWDATLYRGIDGQLGGQPTDLWNDIAGPMGHCREIGCGLLIIDNATTALEGTDGRHIRAFLDMLKQFAYEQDAAVILLHHPPKDGSDYYAGRAEWARSLRYALSLTRSATYDRQTGQDSEKRVLRAEKHNWSGEEVLIHMHWEDGILLYDEPPAARAAMSQADRIELDYKVLTALRFMLSLGWRVVADPIKPESLPKRLARQRDWQHIDPHELEDSVERLIKAGQAVIDQEKKPATIRPAS